MKVLIIGDDPEIVEYVRLAFKVGLPEVKLASVPLDDGVTEIIDKESPDLVILDPGLPDIDSLKVLRQIRLFSSVPILILTVRGSESDIVKGLEGEADAYVVKPFEHSELLARVKAVTRRK